MNPINKEVFTLPGTGLYFIFPATFRIVNRELVLKFLRAQDYWIDILNWMSIKRNGALINMKWNCYGWKRKETLARIGERFREIGEHTPWMIKCSVVELSGKFNIYKLTQNLVTTEWRRCRKWIMETHVSIFKIEPFDLYWSESTIQQLKHQLLELIQEEYQMYLDNFQRTTKIVPIFNLQR